VSDLRKSVITSGAIVSYSTDVKAWSDYYAYGYVMPGRSFTSQGYRYGFQGQERDDEIKGAAPSLNYEYRMHDPRVGRFFMVDPIAAKYPFYSHYSFSGNRVTDAVELEGLEARPYCQRDGSIEGEVNTGYVAPSSGVERDDNNNIVSIKPSSMASSGDAIWHSGSEVAPSGWYTHGAYQQIIYELTYYTSHIYSEGSGELHRWHGVPPEFWELNFCKNDLQFDAAFFDAYYSAAEYISSNHSVSAGIYSPAWELEIVGIYKIATSAISATSKFYTFGRRYLAGIRSSPSAVLGNAYSAYGEKVVKINNMDLLTYLQRKLPGAWEKIYEAAEINGSKVELHYF
jgi:RHS repeat-associated protein